MAIHAYFADDQTTVVVPIGEEIDETLQTAEAGLLGVLVLVRPGGVALEVVPGERQVHAVERNDQVLRIVHLGERVDYAGLLTDTPGKGLVCNTIPAGEEELVPIYTTKAFHKF